MQKSIQKSVLLFLIFLLIFSFGCSGKDKQNLNELKPETEEVKKEQQETNKKIASLVKVDKELPGAFIVSIDNHPNANPQSGLDKADRVYEILAEGGITRYLAIFHSQEAEKIGPIRSARYYFAYIVKGHDFPFAHAGGNTNALALIPKLKIKDLDEIYNAGSYFWRTKDRKMPHNLYTSTERLLKGSQAKKHELLALKPLLQGNASEGEPINLIDITYSEDSRNLYTVTYEWDGERYKRYINGTPHKTLEDTEIFTENIIIMEAKTRQVVKEELESEIQLIGSGKACFFTDGKYYEGTWKKDKAEAEFEFIYEEQPMEFKGEHAWINIVPSLNIVQTINTP